MGRDASESDSRKRGQVGGGSATCVCTYGCRRGFTLEHGDDHKTIFSDVVVLQGRFVFQNLTLVDQNLVRVRA